MNNQAGDPRKVQASLRKSVNRALERKRRLGQYAVVWRDGQTVRIGGHGAGAERQQLTK